MRSARPQKPKRQAAADLEKGGDSLEGREEPNQLEEEEGEAEGEEVRKEEEPQQHKPSSIATTVVAMR